MKGKGWVGIAECHAGMLRSAVKVLLKSKFRAEKGGEWDWHRASVAQNIMLCFKMSPCTLITDVEHSRSHVNVLAFRYSHKLQGTNG